MKILYNQEETKSSEMTEDQLRKLQDEADVEGILLPTELNMSIRRKYADDPITMKFNHSYQLIFNAMQTQIKRRYTPSNKAEYKIYSEWFDKYLMDSNIMNSENNDINAS